MARPKKSKAPKEIIYQTQASARAMAGNIPVFCAYDRLVSPFELVGNPRNPNQHPQEQIQLLAHIIQSQGWRAPITVSNQSGYVVRGHGRLAAALYFNAALVPVDYQNYDSDAEEWADLIADNRLSELSEINTVTLADLLTEMDTGEIPMILSGYTEEDIESILSAISGDDDAQSDGIDDAPSAPEKPMTQPGDLWCLGNHRLICGSATDPGTVERLMDGELANLVFTDPPYGVEYTGSGRDKKAWEMIKNDDKTGDDLTKLLIPAFKNMVNFAASDAAFYIWHADITFEEFIYSAKAAGLSRKALLVWAKNNFVLGKNDYHQMHECCIYAEKQGFKARFFGDRTNTTIWRATLRGKKESAASVGNGIVITDGAGNRLFIANKPPKDKKVRYFRAEEKDTITLVGDNANFTVWEIAKDTKIQHPTQKPVELATRAIENSTEAGESVLDLFGGSGTTLIGAELTGRTAYLTELDPKYCDVIVNRYVRVTGNLTATCVRNGKTLAYAQLKSQNDEDNGREPELR
ncbi:MAG: DNA modification methylase [Clostridiales bacterium]|jgi:DNA modification methylase|nr:DNA modification methylase [Clostridiales bacterium]